MTDRTSTLARDIDLENASVARVYDALLGGKDNFASDREVYRSIVAADPLAPHAAQEVRRCLGRVVDWLVRQAGVDQFLDLGSGLPTAENTHEIAQRINPDAEVVYVDNDPSVIAHGRALMQDNESTWFTAGDLADPDAILDCPVVSGKLDLQRPYALVQFGTLHHLDDSSDPRAIMQKYVERLPSGAYVALCHFFDAGEEDPDQSAFAQEMQQRLVGSSMGSGRFRTRAEILSFLEGMDLVEPGLVKVHEWWPIGPRMTELSRMDHSVVVAVARKP
jgi:hypothetical protein